MLYGRINNFQCNCVKLFCISKCECKNGSRDSSVGIGLGCSLDDRGVGVRFPAGAINFSLLHKVQLSPGAHLIS
jgi:hypothetical protein